MPSKYLKMSIGKGQIQILYFKDVTLDQIEDMRQTLMTLAEEKGFTHEDTITISQTLDQLLNRYSTTRWD